MLVLYCTSKLTNSQTHKLHCSRSILISSPPLITHSTALLQPQTLRPFELLAKSRLQGICNSKIRMDEVFQGIVERLSVRREVMKDINTHQTSTKKYKNTYRSGCFTITATITAAIATITSTKKNKDKSTR